VSSEIQSTPCTHLLNAMAGERFRTILADPPWRFQNRTGKNAPEHKRLARYETMDLQEICALPVAEIAAEPAHLYLWVPNALLLDGLEVMQAWGFNYTTNLVWRKIRKDGGSDGRGTGFYFRNVTEIVLFGVRGEERANAGPRPHAGELPRVEEARALTQAGRALRHHRGLQPRLLRRTLCARSSRGLGRMGRPGGQLCAQLADLCVQLCGGRRQGKK
jgi:MT-A70